MAHHDQAAFKLRFEHVSPASYAAWADVANPKLRFWGPFIGPGPEPTNSAGGVIRDLEESILDGQFVSSLADRISRSAGTKSGSGEGSGVRDERTDLRRLSRESFSLAVIGPIRYGSAEITLVLEGAKHVAEAFDNNFELFRSALEAYAPEAWNSVIPALPMELTCEVKDANALKAVFDVQAAAPSSGTGASAAEDEKARRLRWLWIASNTSLIVPCLLALAVLYVALQHVSHFEINASERMGHLELEKVNWSRPTRRARPSCTRRWPP